MTGPTALAPVMTADEINAYVADVYPQLTTQHGEFVTTEVFPGGCVVRVEAGERHFRAGDTVSGPTLMTLADMGGYVCVLSHLGRVPLSVTVNLNINFMRKASAGPIDAHCRILKLGRSLLVYDAELVWGRDRIVVAHATGTYSIPPGTVRP
ncbi:MAG: PaaI family thioesterase [Rhizobiaceae bacterium]|nr:PaaI family thioesterase [Rhizobiaceae bacterium]MCV0406410.1 PaaI family thioesterase [Rhizobiaceae bacterium]